jgi:hypothetical protein
MKQCTGSYLAIRRYLLLSHLLKRERKTRLFGVRLMLLSPMSTMMSDVPP